MPPAIPRDSASRAWWSLFDPRFSLRARAALLVGAAGVAFVAFSVWRTGNVFRRTLEAQLGPTLETLAFQVSDKIDRGIHERLHQLQLAANLAAFRGVPDDASGAQRRQLLETLQQEFPDLAWIGFADASGSITASTARLFEGTSAATRPWFRLAREKPYAGSLHEIPELPRPIAGVNEDAEERYLDLSIPVPGADGRFRGVLGAHLRWSWAADVARSVVNETANRNQIGVTIYSGSTDILFDSGVSGWTIPPDAPAVSNPRTYRGSFVENFSHGGEYLTGFARSRGFRDYHGVGWMSAVRQPTARAFAPVQELQRAIGRWGLAFAAALTVGAWVFVTPLTRRMLGIKSAANRIRSGDILAVMPRHRGESEMSEMCDALARLVKELREKEPPSAPEVAAPVVAPRETGYVKPTGTDPRRVVW